MSKPTSLLRFEDLPRTRQTVRVMPLGGLGEIGMNCMLFESGGEVLMLDCGQMMPDEEMLGVDYVIPDTGFLQGHEDRLKGIVLTHAHEDHIGALPYVLPRFPEVTVHASELTANLLREKLKEHGISPRLRVFRGRERFQVGDAFDLEPLAVTHSIIDSFGFALRTPAGAIIHSGDFKIDPNPPDGVAFDHYAFARHAEGEGEGVLLLLSDSTNVDRRGSCPSEMEVIPGIEEIFRTSPQAMVISTFASSLHRIQNVLNLAAEHRREVVALGLNMERNIRIASQLGVIDIPGPYHDDARAVRRIPRERRLILCTGSQGEAMSSLSRIAMGTHRDAAVEPGDVVVVSARRIPGNENAIYRMTNHLSRRGARVVHEGMGLIHVSGHAYRDDMKHLINLTNPRYFVPVHGEFRHLRAHCALAQEQGLREEETFLLENGDCLEVSPSGARLLGKIPHGRVLVDGTGIGDVDEVVLRDRRYLADDGMVVVILGVDRESGDILSGPEVAARGFVLGDDGADSLGVLKDVVVRAYEDLPPETRTEHTEVQAALKRAVRHYIKKTNRRFPVILPVVMEL